MKPTEEKGIKPLVIKFRRVVSDSELAERIKITSVGKLAKYLGYSSQHVSMIIHGDITISETVYQKIKNYFEQ